MEHDHHDRDHHGGRVHVPKDFGPMFAIAAAINVVTGWSFWTNGLEITALA
jgi:hypothetical protein